MGNNFKNRQKIKKVKDTILSYLHTDIYVNISASYVKRCICRTMTPVECPQTNKHTNTHIHTQKHTILSKNWGNLFYRHCFIFHFYFCNSLKVKKTVSNYPLSRLPEILERKLMVHLTSYTVVMYLTSLNFA